MSKLEKKVIDSIRPAATYTVVSVVAVSLVLLVLALAGLVYTQGLTVAGKALYPWLLQEDGLIEQLTAILLGVAALFSFIAIFRLPNALRWARTFLALFAVFCILMALEEISWGQRILGIESNEFFQKYSDQKEINFHNVMQQYLKREGYALTKTRSLAAITLFIYGVVLPILAAFRRPSMLFRKLRIVVPPPALIPGFLAGAFLTWFDRPTGREEELGEFLFSLCFALLVPLWCLQQRYADTSARTVAE